MSNLLPLEMIVKAGLVLKQVVKKTPLERNDVLSEAYNCNVYCKREDLQVVRSFKIRGAYNKMISLSQEELKRGVVCASAGNHAQGVAFSCKMLRSPGKIFMPVTTPKQKVSQVMRFGGQYIEVVLVGDTFDDSFAAAQECCNNGGMTFIHPFNDPLVIAGQGTVAIEIMEEGLEQIDYIFTTIGGGGLVAGVGTYIKNLSPQTKIIGVEPAGAASMKASFEKGEIVTLDTIDKFVDGAAVKRVGELTFDICREILDDIITVPEGKVCTSILQLYNDSAMVLEPAGALPVAALDYYKEEIKGKNVVCIISGGNNDIDRMQEIKEKSLLFEGLMHYFIIDFPQRPGALKEFVVEVLGPHDDITRFEYTKANNKEKGPTLVGIELSKPEDYQGLLKRLTEKGFKYTVVNDSKQLLNLFI
ncbi:MAG: threonine ammonia-lyase IlvA [Bacillota bacterium]|jgi:threonine dehydratase